MRNVLRGPFNNLQVVFSPPEACALGMKTFDDDFEDGRYGETVRYGKHAKELLLPLVLKMSAKSRERISATH